MFSRAYGPSEEGPHFPASLTAVLVMWLILVMGYEQTVFQLLETESWKEEALPFLSFLLAWRQMYWLEMEHETDD